MHIVSSGTSESHLHICDWHSPSIVFAFALKLLYYFYKMVYVSNYIIPPGTWNVNCFMRFHLLQQISFSTSVIIHEIELFQTKKCQLLFVYYHQKHLALYSLLYFFKKYIYEFHCRPDCRCLQLIPAVLDIGCLFFKQIVFLHFIT